MTTDVSMVAGAALAGLALGSFAVTTGLRMASGDDVFRGRSRCDHCRVELGFARTIPIVSHLSLQGACSTCGGRIDPTHLAGEIAGATVAAVAFAMTPDLVCAALVAILGLTLIAASAADLKAQVLPDGLTLLIAGLAALLSLNDGRWSVLEGVLAAALTFAGMQAVRLWSMRGGRAPGLGFGDVKLAAALALWLGVLTPWMVLVASAIGILAMALVRPVDGRLPFGPALASSAWLVGVSREVVTWLA